MNSTFKIYSINLFAVLLLSSCSSNFTGRGNLDSQNFRDYFAPSKVTIYASTDEFKGKHKYIGLVDGEDCQAKQHHAEPDNIIARTEARKKAYHLKANAIVFAGCVLLTGKNTSKQCVSSTVCYGQSYFIESNMTKN